MNAYLILCSHIYSNLSNKKHLKAKKNGTVWTDLDRLDRLPTIVYSDPDIYLINDCVQSIQMLPNT
jgi:hypothetical protein